MTNFLANVLSQDSWRPPTDPDLQIVVPVINSANIIGSNTNATFRAKFEWSHGSAGSHKCDHREVTIEIPCTISNPETHGYVDLRRSGTFEFRQIDFISAEELPIPGRVTQGMFNGMHKALEEHGIVLDAAAVVMAAERIYTATRTPVTREAAVAFEAIALASRI